MTRKNTKYLLCRPEGGLNDTLCQIEKCWRHAETYGRHLVIDTSRSGLMDDILRYFEPREDVGIQVSALTPELAAEFDAMQDVIPAVVTGRVSSYSKVRIAADENLGEVESGEPLRFDLDRDHDAQLLVHHQFGGGKQGFGVLRRMRLRPPIAVEVVSRHRDLQPGYAAIHIRNTDMKTDYEPVFAAIRLFVKGRTLLVCSDDLGCIDYARDYYGTSVRVVSNANIPDTGGKQLHYNDTIDRFQANCDALADLFWMAMSNRLFLTVTEYAKLSGFSRLAGQLASNKEIARSLVGAAVDVDAVQSPRGLAGRKRADPFLPVWRVRRASLLGKNLHVAVPYRIRGEKR